MVEDLIPTGGGRGEGGSGTQVLGFGVFLYEANTISAIGLMIDGQ
jgi:hypothetical protein